MSSPGGRLWEGVAYESLDIMGKNFSSLGHGNCLVLISAPIPMQCFTDLKVNFEKKNRPRSQRIYPGLISLSFQPHLLVSKYVLRHPPL